MRTPAQNAALERSLSRERLGKYLEASGHDIDAALDLYERNSRLSEAFYTPLQGVEICLRNSIHSKMAATYGDDWPDNGRPPLQQKSREMIASAYDDPCFAGRDPAPCDIVATVRFAFWVGLLGPSYDSTLWRSAVWRAFTGARHLRRRNIHGRLNAIRRFRNRVAHHEPIFDRDLVATHDEIVEAIRWMCQDTAAWVEEHSRFPGVYEGP